MLISGTPSFLSVEIMQGIRNIIIDQCIRRLLKNCFIDDFLGSTVLPILFRNLDRHNNVWKSAIKKLRKSLNATSCDVVGDISVTDVGHKDLHLGSYKFFEYYSSKSNSISSGSIFTSRIP